MYCVMVSNVLLFCGISCLCSLIASRKAIYDKFAEEGLKRGVPDVEGGTDLNQLIHEWMDKQMNGLINRLLNDMMFNSIV